MVETEKIEPFEKLPTEFIEQPSQDDYKFEDSFAQALFTKPVTE
jgi:hypothetical protein